jgi:nitrogen regulatory protein PII
MKEIKAIIHPFRRPGVIENDVHEVVKIRTNERDESAL